MVSEAGQHGLRHVARVFQGEGSLMERGDQGAVVRDPAEVATVSGRALVVRIGFCQFFEGFTGSQHGADRVEAGEGRGGVGRRLPFGAHHDVAQVDVVRTRLALVHLDDMIAIPGAKDGGHFTRRGAIGPVLERLHHTPSGKVAQITPGTQAVALGRRVLRMAYGQFAKVGAGQDGIAQGHHFLIRGQGVFRRSVRGHADQDVAGRKDLLLLLIEITQQGRLHFLFEQIGASELFPVGRNLLLQRRVAVQPGVQGCLNLEAKIEIAFEKVDVGLQGVIGGSVTPSGRFGIGPLEVIERDDALRVAGHDVGIIRRGSGLLYGGGAAATRPDQGQDKQDKGGLDQGAKSKNLHTRHNELCWGRRAQGDVEAPKLSACVVGSKMVSMKKGPYSLKAPRGGPRENVPQGNFWSVPGS